MEEWSIEPFKEKRRIRCIRWSDGQFVTDRSDGLLYIHRDPMNHEVWVIQINENGETIRYNSRFLESIEWYK